MLPSTPRPSKPCSARACCEAVRWRERWLLCNSVSTAFFRGNKTKEKKSVQTKKEEWFSFRFLTQLKAGPNSSIDNDRDVRVCALPHPHIPSSG